MKNIISILTIVLAGIIFIAPLPAIALEQKTPEWKGKLKNGQTLSEAGLSKILKEHKDWLSSLGEHGARANLSGADLREANLSEADLSLANLREANLSRAFLSGANLSGADLSLANLNWVKLGGAELIGAKLRGADLNGAHLNGANLWGAELIRAKLVFADLRAANLSGADLREANLRGAELIGANLKGAKLIETNLKYAYAHFSDFSYSYFEPKNVEEFVFLGAKGLSTIRFDNFTAAVDLRAVAKETGLRSEERALTSALYKYHLRGAPFYERIFEHFLLGSTTDYGASPWRSFCVLAFFIVIFSFYYMIILRRRGKDGIWKIWIPERVRKDLGKNKPIRLNLHGLAAWRIGFYFSVLSAFNIGWRELNVGNWISRVQRQEYIYRATGWTRTISGIQSLLSVYLLALWALTYFGRPFE